MDPGDPLQRLDDIRSAVALSDIDRGDSRLKASTIVRMRMRRPSNSWSDMKSIAHTSFGAAAGQRSSRSFAETLRFGVLLRSSTWIRRYP